MKTIPPIPQSEKWVLNTFQRVYTAQPSPIQVYPPREGALVQIDIEGDKPIDRVLLYLNYISVISDIESLENSVSIIMGDKNFGLDLEALNVHIFIRTKSEKVTVTWFTFRPTSDSVMTDIRETE